MEFRVESAEGSHLPVGCYVGIWVGDVLKQGKHEPNRSYQFRGIERQQNAKIDIFQHIGSCLLGIEPDSKSVHEVAVTCSDPEWIEKDLRLKVHVTSQAAVVNKHRELRAKQAKSEARDYLARHCVEAKLAEAVRALVKDQPEDAIEFLCRHLRGDPPNMPRDVKIKTTKPEQARAPAELAASTPSVYTRPEAEEDAAKAAACNEALEALRVLARDAILQHVHDKLLASHCQDTSTANLAEVGSHAHDGLMTANTAQTNATGQLFPSEADAVVAKESNSQQIGNNIKIHWLGT